MTATRAFLVIAVLLSSFAVEAQPQKMVDAGDRLFFTFGTGLWVTDGTPLGTNRVELDGVHMVNVELVAMKGKAYFIGYKGFEPWSLYVTDGRSPAKLVMKLGDVFSLSTNGSQLFFFLRSSWMPGFIRLLASDGTEKGTKPIAVLATDEARSMAVAGRRMFFRIYAPSRFEWRGRTEYELWSTDGTAEGTGRVLERMPYFFTRAGRLLYLLLRDSTLHRSDGTTAGTFPIAPARRILGTHGEMVYFAADDAVFKTDGTLDGTADTGLRTPGTQLFVLGSRTVVFANDRNDLQLHAADGNAPLQLVRTLPAGPYYQQRFLQLGEQLFFSITTQKETEVWRTDGTAAGTVLLATSPPLWGSPMPIDLFNAAGRLLFWKTDAEHGTEPWTSDGTPEGTRLLANLFPDGTIRGRVSDAATGAPVTDVVIEIHRQGKLFRSAEVDEQGRYEIHGIAGLPFVVRARTTGAYIAETRSPMNVPYEEHVRVDFRLELGGRIAGRVTDTSGAPIAGASVHVAASIDSPRILTARTNADGTYETTGIPAGRGWVVWTDDHSGFSQMIYDGVSCIGGCSRVPAATPVAVALGETRRGVDFRLLPDGKLRVRLIDAVTGKPIARHVNLHIYDLAKPWRYYTTHSTVKFLPGEEREFALPNGRYALLATFSQTNSDFKDTLYPDQPCSWPCTPHQEPVAVTPVPGTTQTLEIRIDAVGARVAGRVVHAQTGAPLEGIEVAVVDEYNRLVSSARTRADGTYETPATLFEGRPYRVRTTGTHLYASEFYNGGDGIPWDGLAVPSEATIITLGRKELRDGINFSLDRPR